MSVTIAGIRFDLHGLRRAWLRSLVSAEGYAGPPVTACASPEGHNVEYDDAGRTIAMTLVNVRWLLDRNGELTITRPTGRVKADELSEALVCAP